MAPRRDDAYRRTMGYETVEQAIRDAGVAGTVSTTHANAGSEVQSGSVVHVKAGDHAVRTKLHVTRNLTVMSEDDAETVACVVTAEEVSLLVADAQEVVIDRLTLKQSGGDGTDDYWEDGLHVVKVLQGTCTVRDSFVFSEHGSGVVVMRQGAAVLERCRVDHCGHYGIGADGPGVLVDCRQTQVVDCKFEDCDARNGARIVGMDDLAHVVGTPVDAAFG